MRTISDLPDAWRTTAQGRALLTHFQALDIAAHALHGGHGTTLTHGTSRWLVLRAGATFKYTLACGCGFVCLLLFTTRACVV